MKTLLLSLICFASASLFAADKKYCFSEKDFSKESVFVFTRGKCANFSAKLPAHWDISLGRKKGDRWFITDSQTKLHVGRFDCDLSNTDQKMLPKVLEKEMKLGNLAVTKYTATQDGLDNSKSAATIVTGLITSYTFKDKALSKLVLMSETYDKETCLDESLEKIVKSLKMM